MKNILLIFLFVLIVFKTSNGQNEPSLLFQGEVKYSDLRTDAYDVMGGFNANEFYISSETYKYTPSYKSTAILQKFSGDTPTLEWEVIDSTNYNQNISPTIHSLIKGNTENSIWWITDKNTFEVGNPLRYNLIAVNTSSGANSKAADIAYNSRSGAWGNNLITSTFINADTDSAKAVFNIIDQQGNKISSFEYAPAYFVLSDRLLVRDNSLYFIAKDFKSFVDSNAAQLRFVKYNLISESIEWEELIYDTLAAGVCYSDFDEEGNYIFAYTRDEDFTIQLYKYSPSGQRIWHKEINTIESIFLNNVIVSDNLNSIILIYRKLISINDDYQSRGFILGHRLDTGDPLYQKEFNFGAEGEFDCYLRSGSLMADNKLVVTGFVFKEPGGVFESNSYYAVFELTSATSVNDYSQTLPENFTLNQNYPNPFNPTTIISYSLPVESNVTLSIYNTLGQEIAQLKNGLLNAGDYKTEWRAEGLSSGVYFYKLLAESTDGKSKFTNIKKMILLR